MWHSRGLPSAARPTALPQDIRRWNARTGEMWKAEKTTLNLSRGWGNQGRGQAESQDCLLVSARKSCIPKECAEHPYYGERNQSSQRQGGTFICKQIGTFLTSVHRVAEQKHPVPVICVHPLPAMSHEHRSKSARCGTYKKVFDSKSIQLRRWRQTGELKDRKTGNDFNTAIGEPLTHFCTFHSKAKL